jgi:hypothetical protein
MLRSDCGLFRVPLYKRSDNKVRELAILCLPWQQWTWLDDVGIPSLVFGSPEKAA